MANGYPVVSEPGFPHPVTFEAEIPSLNLNIIFNRDAFSNEQNGEVLLKASVLAFWLVHIERSCISHNVIHSSEIWFPRQMECSIISSQEWMFNGKEWHNVCHHSVMLVAYLEQRNLCNWTVRSLHYPCFKGFLRGKTKQPFFSPKCALPRRLVIHQKEYLVVYLHNIICIFQGWYASTSSLQGCLGHLDHCSETLWGFGLLGFWLLH